MRTEGHGSQRSGHRLPKPLSRFVGREHELAALTRLIQDRSVRLISVMGPGGVGKTRLVTQAALDMESGFGGRIAFIRLDDSHDPDDVLPAIARAIGADDPQRSLRETLIQRLGNDRWLLVIDNFEHLLPAAHDVAEVLQHVAGTTALITTRARLQLVGEYVFPLAPLPVPAADLPSPIDLNQFAATQLFVDRAITADTRFKPDNSDVAIAAICRRLDGIPLAIELAAARVAIMSPTALMVHLDADSSSFAVLRGGPRDSPARLRTVEAAIAWSYDLLSPIEQEFFRRLSVFAGGFTLAWAAAMIRGHRGGEAYPIDAGIDPRLHWFLHLGRDFSDITGRRMDAPWLPELAIDPMDGIQALLDGSLLQTVPGAEANQPRYKMLESVREFGMNRLQAFAEEDAVRTNHAAVMLGFVEIMREEMWNAPQASTTSRIEAELTNIRGALNWAAQHGPREAELALRLPQSLWLFWQTRGYVAEGRSWLDRALALDAGPAWERAAALTVTGLFAWIQSDLDRAEAAIAAARAYWQTTGNKFFLGQATLFSGLIAWVQGDLPLLISDVEAALALFRACEGRHGIGTCLILLAIVAHRSGDPDRARRLLDEARTTCEAARFGWGSASSSLYAAEIEREHGNLQAAAVLSIEALDRFWAEGDPWGTGAAMSGIALLAAANGDMMLAARLLGASAGLRTKAAAFLPTMSPESFVEAERHVRNALGPGRFDRAYAAGHDLPPESAIKQAQRFARSVMVGKVRTGETDPLAGLTPQQRAVLQQVGEGRTARHIAATMFLSERTVERHRELGLKALGMTREEFMRRLGGDGAYPSTTHDGVDAEVSAAGS